MATTANNVLKLAKAEVGYCRYDDPKRGTKYGRWYADLTNSSYFGTNGVPFCAMFVSYILKRAGQSVSGFPTASCLTAVSGARKAGLVLSNKKNAKAGDIVIFDWEGNGVADHVGFVEKNYGTYIQTIEGNTTGNDGRSGSVARRTRAWSTVMLVIRPKYKASSSSSSSSTYWQLEVDGIWGEDTTKLAQKIEGIIVSGKVYNQPTSNKSLFAKGQCNSFVFSKKPKSGGSLLIRRIQNDCGIPWKNCDGYFGPDSIKRFIKKWVKNPNHFKSLLNPSIAVKNYQKYLNKQAKALKIKRS